MPHTLHASGHASLTCARHSTEEVWHYRPEQAQGPRVACRVDCCSRIDTRPAPCRGPQTPRHRCTSSPGMAARSSSRNHHYRTTRTRIAFEGVYDGRARCCSSGEGILRQPKMDTGEHQGRFPAFLPQKKSRYSFCLKRDSQQSDRPDLHGADEQGTLAATDAMQSCTLPCVQHLSPTFRAGLRPSVSVPDEKGYG